MSTLECAASLALAALVVSATTHASEASASLLRRARATADALDVARTLLEHELGEPCALPPECPQGYVCAVSRGAVTALADRVTVKVERNDGVASEELRTLAPAPACGS